MMGILPGSPIDMITGERRLRTYNLALLWMMAVRDSIVSRSVRQDHPLIVFGTVPVENTTRNDKQQVKSSQRWAEPCTS